MTIFFHAQKPATIHLLMLLIFFLGLAKLGFFLAGTSAAADTIFAPDSSSYIHTAQALQKNGTCSVSVEQPERPQLLRTPGYPLFIRIFLPCSSTYRALIIVQILLSLGTIVLAYFLALQFWPPAAALLSAGLLALDIASFVNSEQILSDTLFTFLLTGSVLIGVYALKSPHVLLITFHSILLACATLVRPISYYLIPALLILFTAHWAWKRNWSRKSIFLGGSLLLLPWMLLVGGWQVRNYLVAGTGEFSTIQGVNLLFYRGAGIIALRDSISLEDAQTALGYGHYTASHPEMTDWSQGQLAAHWKHEGMGLIRHYPGLFLKSQFHGLIKMLFDPADYMFWKFLGNYSEQTGPLRDFFELSAAAYWTKWVRERSSLFLSFVLAESYLLLMYAGSLFSLCWIQRHRADWGYHHIFIWSVIIYFLLLSAGPEAYARFRIPLMPVLSVYAGHGIFRGAFKVSKIFF
ncbi:hypothetical protein CSB45_05390 [candidate division KSB3 bacterium]|uniref:Glycosyltransferase RgtA/B/C/D-like domain-containing protein n=1 Tax=candidate division KSB3 bacterium TaxID=2044937 RepID=A0A2G6E8L7_9BACT|nr:MAG: hypothetical protein CSB45_05390 [candidate division KSB3 bacterium]PIE30481.1 MAG: hypothetical protein CSA57_04155 [candidate division KSB3 bacterium]